jgi:hypothetical protein
MLLVKKKEKTSGCLPFVFFLVITSHLTTIRMTNSFPVFSMYYI